MLETAKISEKVISQSQARLSSSALVPKTMAKPELRKQVRLVTLNNSPPKRSEQLGQQAEETFARTIKMHTSSSRIAICFHSERFRLECPPFINLEIP